MKCITIVILLTISAGELWSQKRCATDLSQMSKAKWKYIPIP